MNDLIKGIITKEDNKIQWRVFVQKRKNLTITVLLFADSIDYRIIGRIYKNLEDMFSSDIEVYVCNENTENEIKAIESSPMKSVIWKVFTERDYAILELCSHQSTAEYIEVENPIDESSYDSADDLRALNKFMEGCQ